MRIEIQEAFREAADLSALGIMPCVNLKMDFGLKALLKRVNLDLKVVKSQGKGQFGRKNLFDFTTGKLETCLGHRKNINCPEYRDNSKRIGGYNYA